jgi:hypothetical protein
MIHGHKQICKVIKLQEPSIIYPYFNVPSCRPIGRKNLTVLGFVFIPLAYIAALVSMSGSSMPGRGLFWVYLVTALSLAGAVLSGYSMLGWAQGK